MAELLFKRYLSENNIETYDSNSAGTHVMPHYSIVGDLKKVMDEKGLDYSGHYSKLLDADIIEESDQIIVMDKGHVFSINSKFPGNSDKMLFLSEAAEGRINVIPDPIGMGRKAYEETYKVIDDYVKKIIAKILKGEM